VHEGNPVNAQAAETALEVMRSVPYFAHLDSAAMEAVAGKATRRRYSRGELIFLEGDPCDGLHVIQEGRIKLYKVSLEGREQIVRLPGPGEFFNEVAVFDRGSNPVSATAALDTTVWVVDCRAMVDLVATHPALAAAIIENLASRSRHLLSLVEDLSLRTVSARLAKLLLARARREAEAPQPMTQQEMAAQLGTVREMVGRVLRTFEDEDLIRFDRHRLIILDREGLEREAMT
jgi:CRP/FNR family cyclic AMP-dependent transcriptional regulator